MHPDGGESGYSPFFLSLGRQSSVIGDEILGVSFALLFLVRRPRLYLGKPSDRTGSPRAALAYCNGSSALCFQPSAFLKR